MLPLSTVFVRAVWSTTSWNWLIHNQRLQHQRNKHILWLIVTMTYAHRFCFRGNTAVLTNLFIAMKWKFIKCFSTWRRLAYCKHELTDFFSQSYRPFDFLESVTALCLCHNFILHEGILKRCCTNVPHRLLEYLYK